MASPLGITQDLKEALSTSLGTNVLEFLEDSVRDDNSLADYFDNRLGAFKVKGQSVLMTRAMDSPVLDLATLNPSNMNLMAFLPVAQNASLLDLVADETGLPFTEVNTVMWFVTRRIVSAPNDGDDTRLAFAYVDNAFVLRRSPNEDQAVLSLVSRAGITSENIVIDPQSASTPDWLQSDLREIPPRKSLPFASPDGLFGFTRKGEYGFIPVKPISGEREVIGSAFAGISGISFQDAILPDRDEVTLSFRPTVQDVLGPEPADSIGLTTSALRADDTDFGNSPVILVTSAPWSWGRPDVDGPVHMYYGQPGSGCAGRDNPQSCAECCDQKQGTTVGIGMTIGAAAGTAGMIAGAELGLLTGMWAGPVGAAVGGLVGGAIGCLAGLLISDNCYDHCNELHLSPDWGGRVFNLTAVNKNEIWETVGYSGIDDQGQPWVLSREEAVAALRGGVRFFVDDNGELNGVHIGFRGRRPFLQTSPNAMLTDNLDSLERVLGLPEKRGVGLA